MNIFIPNVILLDLANGYKKALLTKDKHILIACFKVQQDFLKAFTSM